MMYKEGDLITIRPIGRALRTTGGDQWRVDTRRLQQTQEAIRVERFRPSRYSSDKGVVSVIVGKHSWEYHTEDVEPYVPFLENE